MSADTLRRAATLMRERAEAATGPEWAEWHMTEDGRAEVFVPNGTMDTETVLEFKDHMDCEECIRPNEADLLHLTSWHPAVALAVAKAMDDVAHAWEIADESAEGYVYDADDNHYRFEETVDGGWLNVARAYLGESA